MQQNQQVHLTGAQANGTVPGSITELIQPIKLLSGSHRDTGKTGQGCFMNVIAYLNGEAQITDQSPCVCRMVRPLAIRLNDYGTDEQRQKLIPFIERAMGSATDDKAIINARMARMRQYGAECQEIINAWRAARKSENANAYADADANANAYANANADAYAYAYANAYANANAYAYANAYANAHAYANADANAKQKTAELKASLFDAGMRYLDDVLPKAEPVSPEVLARGESLMCAFKAMEAA